MTRGNSQKPPVHKPEVQSVPAVHAPQAPTCGAQMPEPLQLPEAQTAELVQGWPLAIGIWQVPAIQWAEAQLAPAVHTEPLGRPGTQTPP
jgi:hypothetical protein